MRKPLYIAIAASLLTAPLYADCGGVKADMDHDGVVTRAEFESYVETKNLYTDVDLNADGYLEENEFGTLKIEFDEDPDLSDWDMDADARLTANEFFDGLYKTFDENEDGHWDGDEWDDAGDAGLFDV